MMRTYWWMTRPLPATSSEFDVNLSGSMPNSVASIPFMVLATGGNLTPNEAQNEAGSPVTVDPVTAVVGLEAAAGTGAFSSRCTTEHACCLDPDHGQCDSDGIQQPTPVFARKLRTGLGAGKPAG